ncbi:hypothetical protein NP493_619g06000 [Ridgeia piscesae]|uniref:DUF7789 domain-containing protein n=1 Tax=Ridgeia piscesae TaxID=27915 RepID=A0AAD9NQK3_RIDPI|nr:hypothetical protein NP493_619g06000 [Ridgeia piscesae]
MDEEADADALVRMTQTTTVTFLGETRRTFAGLMIQEWIFLAVSIVNIAATIGLTIERIVVTVQSDPSNPDFTFALLLLINAVFCLAYAIHGLLREREYELYVLMAGITVVLSYCVLGYAVNPTKRTRVKLVSCEYCISVMPFVSAWILIQPSVNLMSTLSSKIVYFQLSPHTRHCQYQQ